MIGAAIALWFVGRRVAGRAGAWIAVILLVSNPYAIRYATETRMYVLEILLVSCGMLVFRRALESPTFGRLVQFGALSHRLPPQHAVLDDLPRAVAGVLLSRSRWRGAYRDAAAAMMLAMAVAGLASFSHGSPRSCISAAAHRDAVGECPSSPAFQFGYTMRDFVGGDEQEGWALLVPMVGLLLLGLFGTCDDNRRAEIDLHNRPGAGGGVALGAEALRVGLTSTTSRAACQLVTACSRSCSSCDRRAGGLTTLADPRCAPACSQWSWRSAGRAGATSRPTGPRRAGSRRCSGPRPRPVTSWSIAPISSAPAVHRLTPRGLDEVTYPSFGSPSLVDWVDYKARLAKVDPAAFARDALARARNHTIWLVTSPGYLTHPVACSTLSTLFASARTRELPVAPDDRIFEHPGLQQFPARVDGERLIGGAGALPVARLVPTRVRRAVAVPFVLSRDRSCCCRFR